MNASTQDISTQDLKAKGPNVTPASISKWARIANMLIQSNGQVSTTADNALLTTKPKLKDNLNG